MKVLFVLIRTTIVFVNNKYILKLQHNYITKFQLSPKPVHFLQHPPNRSAPWLSWHTFRNHFYFLLLFQLVYHWNEQKRCNVKSRNKVTLRPCPIIIIPAPSYLQILQTEVYFKAYVAYCLTISIYRTQKKAEEQIEHAKSPTQKLESTNIYF